MEENQNEHLINQNEGNNVRIFFNDTNLLESLVESQPGSPDFIFDFGGLFTMIRFSIAIPINN